MRRFRSGAPAGSACTWHRAGTPTAWVIRTAARCSATWHANWARKLAFLCVREYPGPDRLGPALRAAFGGAYIANERFTFDSASQLLAAGEANPDTAKAVLAAVGQYRQALAGAQDLARLEAFASVSLHVPLALRDKLSAAMDEIETAVRAAG